MAAAFSRSRLAGLTLTLILLASGMPQLVSQVRARDALVAQALVIQTPSEDDATGRIGVPPSPDEIHALDGPTASGANPVYPLNHTFDADSVLVGTPPTNYQFETDPASTGTPPTNSDLESASSDLGTPPTNHDFETGDFTGWTTTGSPTIQTASGHGSYAKLVSGAAITSAAFTVDSSAQVLYFDLYFISATGYAGVEVYVLSGASYSTSTLIDQIYCYQCGTWTQRYADLSAFAGQSIKLKVQRYLGDAGVDVLRPASVFPNTTLTGKGVRIDESGDDSVKLDTGTLTTAAFTVASTAQYASVDVKGQSASSDTYTIKVLSGGSYTTETTVTTANAADSWTTVRFNVVAWAGQSIKLKVSRTAGSVGVDDLGVQAIEIADWDLATSSELQHLTGGPDGDYLSLAPTAGLNGKLTSAAFTLPSDAQQLTLQHKGGTAGSTFYVELLTGGSFSTVVDLAGAITPSTTEWTTLKVAVATYAGQTVKLRIRQYFGTGLYDAAGVGEQTVPGWTLTGSTAVDAGADANGTYVTALPGTSSAMLRSVDLSTGIFTLPGHAVRMYHAIAYDIGQYTGSLLRVTWYNPATSQNWVVFLDAANSPTGHRLRYFPIYDFMGTDGYFVIQLPKFGKLYSFDDNIARQHLSEPFTEHVGMCVNTSTGAYGYTETDLAGGGAFPLVLTRYYNAHSDRYDTLGYRWSHTFDTRLYITDEGDAGVIFGSGREEFFDWLPSPQEFVETDLRVHDTLVKNGDGSYTFTTTSNLTYEFTATGRLTSIADQNDNSIDLTYNGSGQLTAATDPAGRELTFAYDGNSRLASVTDEIGAVVSYTYDANGDLVTVTDPEDGERTYAYSKHRLVSVLDPNGDTVVETTLDAYNRVISQTDAGDETITLEYSTPDTGVTTVSDPAGNDALYYFDRFARTTHMVDPLNHVITRIYDNVGNLEKVIDPDENTWEFAYTSEADPSEITDPLGNPVTYTWNAQHLPTTITDALGETTTITYDGDGNPLTITDPRAGVTTMTYDGDGNVLTVTNPLDATWTYDYDLQGNLISQTDPLDNTWTYTYDDNGRVATATDPNGNTTTYYRDLLGRVVMIVDALAGATSFLYDPAGHLLSVTDALENERLWDYDERGLVEATTDEAGETTTYTYDENRNITAITDPLGHVTTYSYDERNRLIARVDASGGETTYTYDDAGRLATKTDPLERVASYAYDAAGRLTSQTLSNGGVFTYTYDDNGNLLTETDPLNHATTYAYDELNRLISATDALDNETLYTYDAAGQLLTVEDPLGGITEYTYDAAGRMLSVTDPLDGVTSYGYDDAGNQTSVTDPLNRTATTVYDDLNRVSEIVNPLDESMSFTYDALGRRTRTTLPSGNHTDYAYDSRGLLTSVTDPLSNVTSYTYDDIGRRATTTDPLGNGTTYSYDAENREATVTDALDGELHFVYDAAGQLVSFTNPRGKTTTYIWNAIGLPLTVTDPLDSTTTYTYDLLGRTTSVTDPRDISASYSYDAVNRPTEISYPGGTIEYTWDDLGRRTSMTDAIGTTTWAYDAGSRVTSVATPQGTVGYAWDAAGQRTSMTMPGSRTVSYDYDDAGRLTDITDWLSNTTSFSYDVDGQRTGITRPNGVTSTIGYDDAGLVTSIVHGTGLGNLLSFSYAYDDNGNRTSVVSGAGTESYSYDDLNRLTDVTYPNSDTAAWTYDSNGNRLTETINGGTPTSYTYNDADQVTSDGTRSFTYDAAGNLTAAGSDSFTWDWASELTAVTVNSVSSTFTYDGDGTRVDQTTNSVTTTYLWDRLAGLPQLIDDGTTAYLHGGGVHASIASSTVTYPLADALGSVRGISNGSGTLTGTADYSAFGTVRTQTGTNSTFGFTGEQADNSTGLLYLRARYLDPGLGRMLSADSVQPNAPGSQGYNRYVYVANNPATWTDPSGHVAASNQQGGGNDYWKLLGLSLLAAPEAKALGVALALVFLRLVCYLNGDCVNALNDGQRKIRDLGSGAAGAVGGAAGGVGEVPPLELPTIPYNPLLPTAPIPPGLGTGPGPGGGKSPIEVIGPVVGGIICLLGLCDLQPLPTPPGGGSAPAPGADAPGTNPDAPSQINPGESPDPGLTPVPTPGPQPRPMPVTPDPGIGTTTPTPNQRANMLIQLQRGQSGRNLETYSIPLVDPGDGGGVTTGQAIGALSQLRSHSAIPRGQQDGSVRAYNQAVAWIKDRPPYGVGGHIHKVFPFTPGDQNTWHFDIVNYVGHNLRR